MKSPKSKGSEFERSVAVKLSKWISSGEREDLLWRSATSGGRATVAKKKGKEYQTQAGDISAVHEDAQAFLNKFYLECKFYRDLNFTGILSGTGSLVKFWNTTVTEANAYKRSPMLIAKQNRYPTVILLQMGGLKLLGLSENHTIISSARIGMYGFLIDDFIKYAKPIL